MTKTTKTAFDVPAFDVAEFNKLFDFSQFDAQKAFEAFKVPTVDTDVVVEAQRRNVEVLTAANKILFEGVQTVAQRQAEILRAMVKEATDAANVITAAKTVEEKLAKQTEVAKAAYSKSFADVRELAQLGTKSGQEAVDLLNARVVEGLEQIGVQVKKVA